MRKVLSFVLVLALVLGSFSMAFAVAPVDVAGTDAEEAVTVLMSLGVVDGYEDGTFKPDQAVTRAEMAKLIVTALGLKEFATGTSSAYSDMAGASWAQGFVAYATKLGITQGYPDGTFKPSQTVSYAEAAAMIVRALGYTDESLAGDWPANYMVKAKTLGIMDDVTAVAGGGANRGNIAQMLYNALDLDIGYINKDGEWVANSELTLAELIIALESEEEIEGNLDNMLERLGAEFDPEFTVEPSYVGDDDVTAIDLTPYVYATVSVYTIDDVIVSIADVESDYVMGELDVEEEIVTDADDDDYEIGVVDADTDVYFNGAETTYGLVDYEYLDGYNVTVYGTLDDEEFEDIDGIDGIVAWAPTAVYLAEESDIEDIEDLIDDEEGMIFDIIVSDDTDELDLGDVTVVGAAAELSEIAEDDVVLVYAALDDSKVKFEVVRDAKDMTVTKKTSTKIYDGTTVFEFAELNTEVDGDEVAEIADFELTGEYTLYLDNNGDILFFEVIDEETTEMYGVVRGLKHDDSFGDDTYEVKMLTSEDEFVVYEVDTEAIYLELAVGKLFMYEVDSDGIITDVEDFDEILAGEEYNSRTNVIDGKFLADDVVVFDISAVDPADWEVSELADEDVVTGSYIENDDEEIVALAFTENTGGVSDDIYFAANEISAVANDDDDTVLEFVGFEEGVATTALSDTGLYDVDWLDEAPAIVLITYTGDVIDTAYIMGNMDYEDADFVDDAGDTFVKIDGYVYEVDDDVVVYVEVYDADDDLDKYVVGDMNDVDEDDFARIIVDDDGIVTLIVLTQEADVLI